MARSPTRGRPRIWLQGLDLERAGFPPGQSYEIGVKGKTVVMTACPDGTRVVTPKKVRSRTLPVTDLNSRELLAVFDGMAAVWVVIKENSIFILPLASELKKQERFQRLRDRLETGQPLRIGSLNSASASILRTQLRELGYTTHERVLNGKEWALENRDRWCMVAVTQGIDFDFDQLIPPAPHNRTLGDDLEDVPEDNPRWQKFSGLVAKQRAGSGERQ